jgi:hypothetical protein
MHADLVKLGYDGSYKRVAAFARAWRDDRRRADPRKIKEVFQDCWAMSDGLKAFQHALEARGYYLAQGDRRGFVAVDWRGEVFSVG